jgi:mRNA interferase RelE/StbE
MTYTLEFSDKAKKQLAKMDKYAQTQIGSYIDRHFGSEPTNPRSHGKPLVGVLKGYWRYEVGKYRLICDIEDNVCRVIVVKAGHRREVYRGK